MNDDKREAFESGKREMVSATADLDQLWSELEESEMDFALRDGSVYQMTVCDMLRTISDECGDDDERGWDWFFSAHQDDTVKRFFILIGAAVTFMEAMRSQKRTLNVLAEKLGEAID